MQPPQNINSFIDLFEEDRVNANCYYREQKELPMHQAVGKIEKSRINESLELYFFDFKTTKDFCYSLNTAIKGSTFFLYAISNPLHVEIRQEKHFDLQKHRPGVYLCDQKNQAVLSLFREVHYQFFIFVLSPAKEKVGFSQQLPYRFFVGSMDLKLMALAQTLVEIHNDLRTLNTIKIHGFGQLMLAGIIGNINDKLNKKNNQTSLTERELEQVSAISKQILKAPETPYSVNFLCRAFGIAPSKLQEGLKSLHNRTLSDYVRNVRVEKAEQLIKTTDLTISEIVYTVGLTSRSYFCKIFKKRYAYSPREYRQRHNAEVGDGMGTATLAI
ncbi:helix-turn-helix domain-containing protein [Sungkyunkwania multivorans]|uniref:Helix-turn-helix domain-containing protein n=1 Tax=Sungkyunkwania multivorans TaxID=1173618 RepID=A0ABW3CUE1_9FLAO